MRRAREETKTLPVVVATASDLVDAGIVASFARLPVAHYWPGTAEAGALFSHEADIDRNFERAAYYVDRILKGTNPADLPSEQPTRYELVLNRKAALAFGIAIPSRVRLRADRIVE